LTDPETFLSSSVAPNEAENWIFLYAMYKILGLVFANCVVFLSGLDAESPEASMKGDFQNGDPVVYQSSVPEYDEKEILNFQSLPFDDHLINRAKSVDIFEFGKVRRRTLRKR